MYVKAVVDLWKQPIIMAHYKAVPLHLGHAYSTLQQNVFECYIDIDVSWFSLEMHPET